MDSSSFMYKFSPKQKQMMDEWKAQQETERRATKCKYLASYTYSFSPTALGTKVVISNSITGQSIDISDYELW
jgi:hypothetical protein